MKNYKKGILTLVVLSTMSLMAAEDRTIYVTTFADEDGENTDKCSLREAIKAAETRKAYGGCPAGEVFATIPTVIQLEKGTYLLNKELRPNSDVIIRGKEPTDYSRPDVLTNNYPATLPLETTISGQGKVRIFNTVYDNKPSLTINNVILSNGSSENEANNAFGGAIYAGGAVILNNVSIKDSKAKLGGAIYLNDISSSLTTNFSVFQGNQANQGSVLGMSCLDNLVFTTRTINISASSILNNGSTNSNSIFNFCGQPTVAFSANTITENTVNPNQGSIIQFSANTPQGKLNFSDNSTLSLLSNTIVKNNGWSTLLYGYLGSKILTNNILAYNSGGKSCRYADGDVSKVEDSGFVVNSNALALDQTSINGQCEIPDVVRKDNMDRTFDVSNIDFSTILTNLEDPSESTAYMPMYFPKDLGATPDLVDVGLTGCSLTDQRGVTRIIAANSNGLNERVNSCDIGATEVLRLTANNILTVNTSVVAALKSYQTNISNLNKDLAGTVLAKEKVPYYQYLVEYYNNLMKFTKEKQKYRTIFVDPFTTSLPAEIVTSVNGKDARTVKHLNADNYEVQVESLGVGMLNEKTNTFDGTRDKNLFCEWDPDLKRILMWRIDDSVTPTGDNEFCQYKLILKSNKSITSSAYIIGSFINIAPITKDATFDIKYGSTNTLAVDLLQYANDDGDGDLKALTLKPNKPKFYVDPNGVELPIRIATNIDPVVITADRSGLCPGEDNKYTCYGGKIYIQLRNTLDPFSYQFTYYVYDADGKISTKEDGSAGASVVTLKNSGTAVGSPRVSGGGSMGWMSLLGLMGLLGYRRYQIKNK